MKPSSFKMWLKRVHTRISIKHPKRRNQELDA
ncbi:MAG: DUF2805 domain-containing protein [Ignavibacteria bacterium]|nr:DUF2805 domain-containing protein [Ignavibacteria bacterium]